MTLTLSEADVERVAQRVVELLDASGGSSSEPPDLVDASEAARLLGVGRHYIYTHADELGAIRLGDGERGRLRFDRKRLVDSAPPKPVVRRTARRRRGAPLVDLLPVKEAA